MAATQLAHQTKKETKTFLALALLQLLEHHTFSDLSIAKVCQRAGLSRMAFYRNFKSLDEVIYEYYSPKISNAFETLKKSSLRSEKIKDQILFFDRYGPDFIAAKEKGIEPIIKTIVIEEIKKFYAPLTHDHAWVTFMANGVYALWEEWLVDGKKRPISEIHQLIKGFSKSLPVD